MDLKAALCGCKRCLTERDERVHGIPAVLTRMVVCPACGDKRCPRAEDHRNACTTLPRLFLPGLKVTIEPALPMHEAIRLGEELAPKVEAWLREQGYKATVIQPR